MDNQDWALLKQGTGEKFNDNNEVTKIKFVDKEFSNQVVQARLAKGIAETIVVDVETSKAVYNGNLVSRCKTFLGIKKIPK
jgi:hypothetical protein